MEAEKTTADLRSIGGQLAKTSPWNRN